MQFKKEEETFLKMACFTKDRLRVNGASVGAEGFPKLIEAEPKVTGVTTLHRVSMR